MIIVMLQNALQIISGSLKDEISKTSSDLENLAQQVKN